MFGVRSAEVPIIRVDRGYCLLEGLVKGESAGKLAEKAKMWKEKGMS